MPNSAEMNPLVLGIDLHPPPDVTGVHLHAAFRQQLGNVARRRADIAGTNGRKA
jgi:hypothetical protein